MAKEKSPQFKVVYRPLSELKPLEDNPRWIKEEDFNKLCASVQNNPELFEAQPIILSDRTGELVIIAGNQRYRAAKEVGLKEVPTILLTGLTEKKEREIIIRTNVTNGKWDWDRLANDGWEVSDLDEWGVDVSFLSDSEDDTDLSELYEEHEATHREKSITITIEVPNEIKEKIDDIKEALRVTLEEWEGCIIKK